MQTLPFFDQKLINKYNTSGPRYTSYPTAVEFSDEFSDQDLEIAVKASKTKDLSLYLHIPFCHSLCYYCGCNKVVTRHRDKADVYLDYLIKEIDAKATYFKDHSVSQIHLGGGTPSFLNAAQLERLVTSLKTSFSLSEELEMGIEIDPREIELTYAEQLFQIGFNRMSIGVQDIDDKVQKAINREQSTRFVELFITHAKKVGFKSINIDLIYGLPHQTTETFLRTINKAIEMNVDRVSLFSYAHLPARFAAQRKIKDEWLPQAEAKFSLMKLAIETFTNNGYDFIGMDHFAKPTDELAIAQKNGSLHRNFQGYTTHGNCDLLGLGVSSISAIGNCFSQNVKDLKTYYQVIDENNTALEQGLLLSQDDLIRGHVIKALMCNMHLNKKEIEEQYQITFDQYFADELTSLTPFINDDLVELTNTEISISPKARLLIRNICMTFDAYMKKHINQQRFSRVI